MGHGEMLDKALRAATELQYEMKDMPADFQAILNEDFWSLFRDGGTVLSPSLTGSGEPPQSYTRRNAEDIHD
jgi:hypothetical protein